MSLKIKIITQYTSAKLNGKGIKLPKKKKQTNKITFSQVIRTLGKMLRHDKGIEKHIKGLW